MSPAERPLVSVELVGDRDVVAARSRARQLAAALGFDHQDQVRIATAVSELARNAVRYAGRGAVRFALELGERPMLLGRVTDSGPGIPDLDAILRGEYASRTGMGIGLTGTRRLMDRFVIDSAPGRGTTVTIGKLLPREAAADIDVVGRAAAALARVGDEDPLATILHQNRDLMRALDEVRAREDELRRLNAELADTNRGVVALYAELDQRATELKRADELKTRFFSFMSHEFRTPVNSILALSRMLIDRVDGPLTGEQEKQVGFIRRSAQGLAELVDDLLDLARVEAGRIPIRVAPFSVESLFGALRGALRPLMPADASVALVFEGERDVPALASDESKVAQVLRNLVSNALKFTERGEVRVRVRPTGDGMAAFDVIDTGIGIAPADLESIFREFGQVDSALQRKVKGSGLGLPLSRKLAALLGGTLAVRSVLGEGSTFTLTLPIGEVDASAVPAPADGVAEASGDEATSTRRRIVLVDDDPAWRYLLRGLLVELGAQVFEAENGADGLDVMRVVRPDVAIIDLAMPVMDGFQTYRAIREDPALAATRLIVCTSRELSAHERDRLTGVAVFLDKTARPRETQLAILRDALAAAPPAVGAPP